MSKVVIDSEDLRLVGYHIGQAKAALHNGGKNECVYGARELDRAQAKLDLAEPVRPDGLYLGGQE